MYYVYLLKDPTTDTAFYCGKGCKDRWKSHLGYWSNNGKNNPCENKIKSLRQKNIEPVVEFLHTNILSEEEAYRLEEEYIRDNFENLVNIKIEARPPKNTGGRHFRKTTKSSTDQSVRLINDYASGKRKHWTIGKTKEEIIRIISAGDPGKSRRGKPSLTKKKVVCNNGCVYDSITQAASFLNLKQGDISNVLTGRQKTTKGYTFTYYN